MQRYNELNREDEQTLRDVIKYYHEQVDIVKATEGKIKGIESLQKRSKEDEKNLKQAKEQLVIDLADLDTWAEDATFANQILKEREQEATPHRVIKGYTKHTAVKTYPQQPHLVQTVQVRLKQLRAVYKTNLRKLVHALTPEELKNAEAEISASGGKQQMKRVYEHYKDLALTRAPSTQAITAEEIEQEQGNPLDDVVPTIQAFARSKLAEKIRSKNIVMPKPPKSSSTSQTQTVVPYNAFKFVEKGKNRYLETISPEKAEELEMKKKTVVLLDPTRYKRKPYVVKSR